MQYRHKPARRKENSKANKDTPEFHGGISINRNHSGTDEYMAFKNNGTEFFRVLGQDTGIVELQNTVGADIYMGSSTNVLQIHNGSNPQLKMLNGAYIDMNGEKIVNVADPIHDTDAVNLSSMNTAIDDATGHVPNTYLNVNGSNEMKANLNAGQNKLINVKKGTNNNDGANMENIDDVETWADGKFLKADRDGNIDMNGFTMYNITPFPDGEYVNVVATRADVQTSKEEMIDYAYTNYVRLNGDNLNNPINVNNQRVYNLEAGTNDNDAVNLKQLNDAISSVKKDEEPNDNIFSFELNGDGHEGKIFGIQFTMNVPSSIRYAFTAEVEYVSFGKGSGQEAFTYRKMIFSFIRVGWVNMYAPKYYTGDETSTSRISNVWLSQYQQTTPGYATEKAGIWFKCPTDQRGIIKIRILPSTAMSVESVFGDYIDESIVQASVEWSNIEKIRMITYKDLQTEVEKQVQEQIGSMGRVVEELSKVVNSEVFQLYQQMSGIENTLKDADMKNAVDILNLTRRHDGLEGLIDGLFK